MDRQTRRILRYRPPPAVVVTLVIVAWIGLSLVWSGHWQLTIPFVVLAVPWYFVWRHHRVSEARRLGLLPNRSEGESGNPGEAV